MLNLIALLQSSSSGSTFSHMLHDIPHDKSAVVVYVLLFGFVYLIWRGNRPSKKA